MLWLFKILEGILLIALFVEIIFRMINRFSAEAREVFRWVYMVGCAGLILIMLMSGLGKPAILVNGFSMVSKWMLVIPVVALVLAILLNKKEIK